MLLHFTHRGAERHGYPPENHAREATRSLIGTEDTEIPEGSICVAACPRVPASGRVTRVSVVHYLSTPSITINPSVMLYTACATIDVVVL